jgi:hypothetical protein
MKAIKGLPLLILILWPAPSPAQTEGCKTRFSVVYSDGKIQQVGLTPDQKIFWREDGAKKYKGFCMDAKDPEIVILWTENVSGAETLNTVVEDVNRMKRASAASPNELVGNEGQDILAISTAVVQQAAHYYVLDMSKKPPQVIHQGVGSKDRPAQAFQANQPSSMSGGMTTVQRGQKADASDFSSTIPDPVEALRNALNWLKKVKK